MEVLALRREILSKKHSDIIRSIADLGKTYRAQGRYNEAEKIEVEVLALLRDVNSEKHPNTLQAMNNLALTWNRQQRRPEALAMIQECFRSQCGVVGDTYPSTGFYSRALSVWGTDRKRGPV